MQTINEIIKSLREVMESKGIDAFIIPSADPHQSEYVCDYWKVREYFSGFTGSAGTLVVTQKEAALWTDSRYFLQVEQECEDSCVTLFKQTIPHAPQHIPWVCNELGENAVIGIDFRQFSKSQFDYIQENASKKEIRIQNYPHLLDSIWENRPELPSEKIEIHSINLVEKVLLQNLKKLKTKLKIKKRTITSYQV